VLAQSTSRQYQAIATLTNGASLNVTSLSKWTSSDTTVATVGSNTGLVQAKLVSADSPVSISVSYTDSTGNTVTQMLNLTVTNAVATSITVTPTVPSIPVGVTQRFNATAAFSHGPTQDISSNVAWDSATKSVATITPLGNATSVSQGTSNITATFEGQSGSATLTVDAATIQSVSITPTSTVLPVGKTISYQATGKFSDGNSYFLTLLPTTAWSSSDITSVQYAGGGSFNTLKAAPPVTIAATYTQPGGSTVTSNPTATIIVTAFPLISIAVNPSTAKVPVQVTTPFAATGTFSDHSTQILTSYVTWASNPASVATISSGSGQPGIAFGVSPGTANITAAFAGVSSANTPPATILTVTNATLTSIAVTPNPAMAASGTQFQYRATGTFSDGSTVDLTSQVGWSSSDITVLTITGQGLATVTGTSGKTAVVTASFTQSGVLVQGTSNFTVQ
jgi:hypothetical protein